jgi:phosphate transport system substrate-binding protein
MDRGGASVRLAAVVPGLVVALLCAALPAGAGAAPEQLFASGCSVSNVGYLTELAADYQKISGVRMFVRGGGSVIGLEDLVAGTSDFAASCRGRRGDDPADIEFVQVAWDALVFIVHPGTPVESISFAGAAAIFQGLIKDWGQLKAPPGPITVFLQRPTRGLTGVETSVRTQVLRGASPATGPNVSQLASTAIVEQLVEKTPGSFAASGYSSARRRAVAMLALDGVKPTRQTIVDRTYPLRRPLYLIVKKPVKPSVRAFLDFALGRQGQALIDSYGAISLREMK